MSTGSKVQKGVKDESYFIQNGAMKMEELIAFCNGKSNPIHNFSEKQLKMATNNYSESQCFLQSHTNFKPISDFSAKVLTMLDLEENPGEQKWDDGYYKLYKGYLEDRPISVKKYHNLGGLMLKRRATTDDNGIVTLNVKFNS
ncbi:putative serine-threonine protein kinase, plant-type [Corchorus olitorius]|uniref:Serine-threonine protein kinase, plant-type n=1 Tax=Corchorus olitorius TaxID=93759 RepID=A0A1R3IM73_9ROSI|nr:putative serine-threonine protein kinase, plant-type [Corchorus olitorius]